MKIEEVGDFKPKCPHCKKEIDHLLALTPGVFEKHFIYVCPECTCIVSVGTSFI